MLCDCSDKHGEFSFSFFSALVTFIIEIMIKYIHTMHNFGDNHNKDQGT